MITRRARKERDGILPASGFHPSGIAASLAYHCPQAAGGTRRHGEFRPLQETHPCCASHRRPASLRNRDVGRAIPALEKALALTPQALDAHLYLAQSHLAARQGEKALADAETVLARQPELPAALAVATLANLMTSRNDAAGATFTRLRSRDPQAARGWPE